MSIRRGSFIYENGIIRQDFWDLVNEYEKRFEHAKKNTNLPDTPNYKMVEDFVISVNERVINGKY